MKQKFVRLIVLLGLLLLGAWTSCNVTPTPSPKATLEVIKPTMVGAIGLPFVVVADEVNASVWQEVPVTDGHESALKLPNIGGFTYSYVNSSPGGLYVAYKKDNKTYSFTLYHPKGDPDARDWAIVHNMAKPTYLKVEGEEILQIGVKGEWKLYLKPPIGDQNWQIASPPNP